MISIRLLGQPQILQAGEPIQVTRRKSRALVYYLAGNPDPIPREALQALFWPDQERSAAQQVLRTTLYGLRKVLGGAIVAQDERLALAPEVEVDVGAFEAAVTAPEGDLERLRAALELYRGDFLGDFYLPDSAEFEDWSSAERERYRRLAVRGLAALSRGLAAAEEHAAALGALDRALEFDPFQEDLQREGLRLHYLLGDRAGAIRRYDRLRKMLDDEMGVPPMAETRALYDAILTERLPDPALIQPAAARRVHAVPAPDEREQLPFIGRAAELDVLRGLEGSGRLALIEGETGIGKTRLAEEYLRAPRPAGALRVLAGAGRVLQHNLSYHPISEALRGLTTQPDWPALRAGLKLAPVWLNEAARLLPEISSSQAPPPTPQPVDELRLWEGLTQLLFALARQAPLALFLDDLQWADASSVALLGYLVRRAADLAAGGRAPVTFLAATRPVTPLTPLDALLQALTREGRVTRIPLERLTAVDTAALAQHLSPASAHPLADWLYRNAEGNPYILSELVRFAQEQHALEADGSLHLEALGETPILPPSVYSLIKSRLDRLSEPARRLLDAAATAGREFEFEVAARATALSEDAALDALDELRTQRLIHASDGHGLRYAFDHSLTLEVAGQEAGQARQRQLHRLVGEALESIHRQHLDEVAGLLAWHFTEGGLPERAAQYALRAARRAAGLAAWSEAIRFYRQALEEIDAAQRVDVYLDLGAAYSRAGEVALASESFHSALLLARAAGDEEQIERAQLDYARGLLSQSRYSEAIELIQQVCAGGQPENRVLAEFTLGTALSLEGTDLAGAAHHLRQAEEILIAGGPPTAPDTVARLAQIKFEQGSVLAQQGALEEGVALYREALDIAGRNPAAAPQHILANNNIAYHLLLLGRPDEALRYAWDGLEQAREQGALFEQTYLLSTQGEILLAGKDLDSAEQSFKEGLDLAQRLGIPERIAGLTANLGLVARERDQTGLAIHRLSAALAQADAARAHHLAAQIRLWLAPLLPPSEARAALEAARRFAAATGRRRLLDHAEALERELDGG